MSKQSPILVVTVFSFWILVGLLTGCHTPIASPSPPSIGPDWQVRQGQALWRPAPGRAELAGELLLASHPTNGWFVQFTKTPLPLVTAWQTAHAWQIAFSGVDRVISGTGAPPPRWIWFQLRPALNGDPLPLNWIIQTRSNGSWRLEDRATGEHLEGFLAP